MKKIVGFSQLNNELEKGNLENWMRCMQTICDVIYIYDQNSSIENLKYYKQFKNVIVVESPINDFENELICKDNLLQKIIVEQPDTDWIFWIDGDTVIDNRLLNKEKLSEIFDLIPPEINGIDLGHLNMWRSYEYYRVDNMYDYFDKVGRTPFWRFNKNLHFSREKGLHSPNNERPVEITNKIRLGDYKLIHNGFATDKQITERYEMYKSKGQNGWALDRLLDENGLTVEKVDSKVLPNWIKIEDTQNPVDKKKLIDLYKK